MGKGGTGMGRSLMHIGPHSGVLYTATGSKNNWMYSGSPGITKKKSTVKKSKKQVSGKKKPGKLSNCTKTITVQKKKGRFKPQRVHSESPEQIEDANNYLKRFDSELLDILNNESIRHTPQFEKFGKITIISTNHVARMATKNFIISSETARLIRRLQITIRQQLPDPDAQIWQQQGLDVARLILEIEKKLWLSSAAIDMKSYAWLSVMLKRALAITKFTNPDVLSPQLIKEFRETISFLERQQGQPTLEVTGEVRAIYSITKTSTKATRKYLLKHLRITRLC